MSAASKAACPPPPAAGAEAVEGGGGGGAFGAPLEAGALTEAGAGGPLDSAIPLSVGIYPWIPSDACRMPLFDISL